MDGRRPGPLRRRPELLGLLVLAGTVLVVYLSTVAIDGGGPLAFGRRYVALLPGDPIVQAGDSVQIAGEPVGEVRSVRLAAGRPRATFELDSGRVGAGARVHVGVTGLAGQVELDLDPGDISHPLPPGSVIPLADAAAGTPITDVLASFTAGTRAALARTLAVAGAGLADAAPPLGHTLSVLPDLLVRGTGLLRALQPGLGDLSRSLGDAAGAVDAPALGPLLSSGAALAAVSAARARAIATSVASAPGIEGQILATGPGAARLLGELATTARTLQPGVAALPGLLPRLADAEHHADGLDTLTRLAGQAAPVLSAASPVLAGLLPVAAAVAPSGGDAATLARVLVPYGSELIAAPEGFTKWGNVTVDEGTAAGHRAVRFTMILTCAHARDPYPAPGQASRDRSACR
ncbi:MAG TPA: MlaD family protein [Solirubrobacteraceae bacterium]|nr:MlaD family protein [Solirubrobacteraceae bacterium]